MANTIQLTRRARVVLVEDSAPMRAAMVAYLRRYADETALVAGEASGGWEAIREAVLKRADIIVVGLAALDWPSRDFVHRLHLVAPRACIIVATDDPQRRAEGALQEAAVCSIVSRTRLISSLYRAIVVCRDAQSASGAPGKGRHVRFRLSIAQQGGP